MMQPEASDRQLGRRTPNRRFQIAIAIGIGIVCTVTMDRMLVANVAAAAAEMAGQGPGSSIPIPIPIFATDDAPVVASLVMIPSPSSPVHRVAVVGAGACNEAEARMAEAVGRVIAERGWLLFTGGLGGVMEAASRGAAEAGGRVVGILPGADPAAANRYVEIPIATGMGHARNTILVQSVDAVVAVGGSHGTLSEIAIAAKIHTPVVGLHTWEIDGVEPAASPEAAIARIAGEEAAPPRGPTPTTATSDTSPDLGGDPLRRRLASLAAALPTDDGEAVATAIAHFDGSEQAFLGIVRMLGRHHDALGPDALHQLADLHHLFATQTKD